MADQAAIDLVTSQISVDLASLSVDETAIGAIIDTGVSDTKVMLNVWRMIVGKAATIVDVSESGSSRQLGVIFDRAKQMVDYWQARSDVEDQQTEVLPARAHGASHRAVRV